MMLLWTLSDGIVAAKCPTAPVSFMFAKGNILDLECKQYKEQRINTDWAFSRFAQQHYILQRCWPVNGSSYWLYCIFIQHRTKFFFFFFFAADCFTDWMHFGSHDKWQQMVIMYTQLLTIQQPAKAATTQQPENFSLLSSQENLPYWAAEKTCPYSAAMAWACALKGEVKLHFTQKDGPRVAFLPLQHAQRVSDAWVCRFAEK